MSCTKRQNNFTPICIRIALSQFSNQIPQRQFAISKATLSQFKEDSTNTVETKTMDKHRTSFHYRAGVPEAEPHKITTDASQLGIPTALAVSCEGQSSHNDML
jgi:hypothetical protein